MIVLFLWKFCLGRIIFYCVIFDFFLKKEFGNMNILKELNKYDKFLKNDFWAQARHTRNNIHGSNFLLTKARKRWYPPYMCTTEIAESHLFGCVFKCINFQKQRNELTFTKSSFLSDRKPKIPVSPMWKLKNSQKLLSEGFY